MEQYVRDFYQEINKSFYSSVTIIKGDLPLIDVIQIEFLNSKDESSAKVIEDRTDKILEKIHNKISCLPNATEAKETVFDRIPTIAYAFPRVWIILPKSYLKYDGYEPKADARQLVERIKKNNKLNVVISV